MRSAQRFFCCLLLLILSAFNAQKAFAQNVIYENDFESDVVGALPANWTVARNLQWGNHSLPCMNGANPAQWQVQDISGNKKVAITINGPNCITEMIPTNLVIPDLSNYVYEFDITFVDNPGADRAMILDTLTEVIGME